MVSAQARREQARYAISRGLSQRRACALIQVSRANLGYVCQRSVAQVGDIGEDRIGVNRSRQALAERHERKLQR